MKILSLCTNDYGGAGTAVLKGVEELCAMGHDAKLIVLNKYSSSNVSVGCYDYRTVYGKIMIWILRIIAKLYKLLIVGRAVEKYCFNNVNLNRVSANKILKLYGDTPEIIIVTWVTDFISFKTVYDLRQKTGARIVFIMTDNAPITGGCHYPWDCKGYQNGCFPCPALSRRNKKAMRTLNHKRRYTSPDMVISGTSNDIERAKASLPFHDCIIIPSAELHPNPFSYAREDSRRFFGINDSQYVILCGADSIQVERKGFREFAESLEIVKRKLPTIEDITIIVAGSDAPVLPDGYDVRRVGKLSFQDLFKAYSCSDLFVCPSLEDSGPMMLNYGVMSFIPVVSFKMGIAQDIIIHKKNGYVASWRDVDDFAEGIVFCKENKSQFINLKDYNEALAISINNNKSLLKYLGIK